MRKTVALLLALSVFSFAPSALASASFANKNLGLGIGYTKFLGDLASVSGILTDWAVPLTLNGGFYIESGFEAYLRIGALFMFQKTGLGADGTGSGVLVGLGGQFGARKLFLEENIRPYVGIHFAGFGAAKEGQPVAFLPGVGTTGGVDFFVGESISLGVQVTADVYLSLVPVVARVSIGGGGVFTTYF
jgi:hypothetical protein